MTATPAPSRQLLLRRIGREVWRLATVAVLGMLLFIVNFGFSVDLGADDTSVRFTLLVLLDFALGLVAICLLPLRHRAPVVVAVVLALTAAFSAFAGPAALLALVSLAARRRPWPTAGVCAVWIVALAASAFLGTDLLGTPQTLGDILPTLIVLVVILVAAVAVGVSIGARRALVESLRERALLVEEEQRLRDAAARDQERTRIAREMHDVLAHRLSLTAMHASALRYRDDLADEERSAAIETVHDNARSALGELRELLTVVRDPDVEAPARPQPTLADIAALLADEPCVDARVEIDLATLSPLVGRHAYRILQECLTNARRHAPGLPVTVLVGGVVGERLELSVRNPLPPSGPMTSGDGFGLTGMRERARAVEGSIEVRNAGGEHLVTAVLPWTLP